MSIQAVYNWSPTLDTYYDDFKNITFNFRKIGFMFPIMCLILFIDTFLNFIPKYIEILLIISYFLLSYEYFRFGETNNQFNFKYYIMRQILNILLCVYPIIYLIINIKSYEVIYLSIFLFLIIIHNVWVVNCFAKYIYKKLYYN